MSHTRFLYHIVFATKDRDALIGIEWEEELFRYFAGIVRNLGGDLIEVNGMPDHVHLLVHLGPCDFAAFMRELKSSSSRWAKQHHKHFAWQRRYGAFTVSESAVDAVRKYIRGQKTHHQKRSFDTEYVEILRRHNVEFDDRYVWE